MRVLTDPILGDRIAHIRRYASRPVIGSLQPDVVLVSHAHRDHLDLHSLRSVARGSLLVLPSGCARLLGPGYPGEVVEVDVGDGLRFGSLELAATPAVHDGRRNPLGRRLPTLGFLVAGSMSIYFAGDTDLFPEMAELSEHLDVALIPVAGWGRRLGPGHLDPLRAAQAAALLRPRVAVPIHWGTFASLGACPDDPGAPAREFADRTAVLAPAVEVRVLAPGAAVELSG